ncbi:hypothetical protein BHE74_00049292 [Ensete ventricosum]|nr:hypothetical protein BHE74_00049292 [Ensete ventricosum]
MQGSRLKWGAGREGEEGEEMDQGRPGGKGGFCWGRLIYPRLCWLNQPFAPPQSYVLIIPPPLFQILSSPIPTDTFDPFLCCACDPSKQKASHVKDEFMHVFCLSVAFRDGPARSSILDPLHFAKSKLLTGLRTGARLWVPHPEVSERVKAWSLP